MSRPRTPDARSLEGRRDEPRRDELLPARGSVVSLSVPGGSPTPHLVLGALAGNRFRGWVDIGGLGGAPVLPGVGRGAFVAVTYTTADGVARALVRRVVSVARDRTRLRLRWPGTGVADLRAHPRVPLDAEAGVVFHGAPGRTCRGTLADISVGGCRVQVDERELRGVEAGQSISLAASTSMGPLVARAEVRSVSGGSVGARFAQLDAATARWVKDLDDSGGDTTPASPREGAAVVWIADGSPAGRSWPARPLPAASDGCPRFELLADDASTRSVAPMLPVVAVAAEGNEIRRIRGRTTYGTHGVEVLIERPDDEALAVYRLARPVATELWLAGAASWAGGRIAITGVGPTAIDVAGLTLREPRLGTLCIETSVGLATVLVHVSPDGGTGGDSRLSVIDPHRQPLLTGEDAAPASWWLPVWLCEQLLAAHSSRRERELAQTPFVA